MAQATTQASNRPSIIVPSAIRRDEATSSSGVPPGEIPTAVVDASELSSLARVLRRGPGAFRIDDLLQQMVWAIVLRYAELMGRAPAVAPEFAYALVDGLFQNELIRFLRGDLEALDRLRRDCVTLLSNVA